MELLKWGRAIPSSLIFNPRYLGWPVRLEPNLVVLEVKYARSNVGIATVSVERGAATTLSLLLYVSVFSFIVASRGQLLTDKGTRIASPEFNNVVVGVSNVDFEASATVVRALIVVESSTTEGREASNSEDLSTTSSGANTSSMKIRSHINFFAYGCVRHESSYKDKRVSSYLLPHEDVVVEISEHELVIIVEEFGCLLARVYLKCVLWLDSSLFFAEMGNECCSIQLIDGDGVFNVTGLEHFMK
ncbi:hypothetical protein ZIOFF_019174 [Zingiber officinale]|uniref:Uncharacterized protein n=1 Tax=Zingiber officinale TaxID=94328 RepID=A0A8J5HDW3_ZINOF|nr:hypothetical protein ZIOFF_019174 [Zingiber officinale]